ncbi:hypothetical protein MHZ92_16530 [Sporosarcina sp. ACRSL]|uniref:hypothetical protein n=1 Tax=Sporosarcina sp. ACRSL TaxID=2918215 RepID=UPI001EF5B237|nr:hypothetical protein [Sporosarcina sp. ACRSL]MCG7345722.1 hypothetical protein [Sporosarcina sp. ACRSL]
MDNEKRSTPDDDETSKFLYVDHPEGIPSANRISLFDMHEDMQTVDTINLDDMKEDLRKERIHKNPR